MQKIIQAPCNNKNKKVIKAGITKEVTKSFLEIYKTCMWKNR